jgi:hypothetical protein
MRYKGILIFSVLTLLYGTQAYCLDAPTLSDVVNLGNAVASAGADFDACNRTGDSGVLRQQFRNAADLCNSVVDIDVVMARYDTAYFKRKNSIAVSGGTCLGDYKQRFDTIMNVIKKLHDTCLNE